MSSARLYDLWSIWEKIRKTNRLSDPEVENLILTEWKEKGEKLRRHYAKRAVEEKILLIHTETRDECAKVVCDASGRRDA